MKHPWLAYLIVGLLSVVAGVAIAGLPDNVSGDATIIPPITTMAADTTVPGTTEATATVATTAPDTNDSDTNESDTTIPDTTGAPTTVADTAAPDTTDSVTGDVPDRSELNVVAANGANIAGAALRMTVRLEELGYVDVLPRDGTDIVEFTTIYFADGFEEAALRLADDLELLPFFVAPIAAMPPVIDLPADVELVTYIGPDRA
jgi:hypothetical protein